jgi:hypothetical protein
VKEPGLALLGTYRCPVTSLRILVSSNLKDSMNFLIAQPPLHRATDQQRRRGSTPTQAHLPAIRVVDEGIKRAGRGHKNASRVSQSRRRIDSKLRLPKANP